MHDSTKRWWHNRANVALVVFLAIGGYFLVTEHRTHLVEVLPWILIGGCLITHLFMHRAHGLGDHHDDQNGSKP